MDSANTDELTINGYRISPGTELSFTGRRGRFTYISSAQTAAGRLVLNVHGGPSGHEMLRSFYADTVRTVHRSTRRRQSA